MFASLPVSLVVAWTIFFGAVNTHQRHAASFKGSSRAFQSALLFSSLCGSFVGIGLLIYYFMHVAWYWPLALFAIGSVAGGLIFGLLDAKVGQPTMSLVAFAAWPAAALWAVFIIRSITA